MSVSGVEGPLYSDFPQEHGAVRKVTLRFSRDSSIQNLKGANSNLQHRVAGMCAQWQACPVAISGLQFTSLISLDELVLIVT